MNDMYAAAPAVTAARWWAPAKAVARRCGGRALPHYDVAQLRV